MERAYGVDDRIRRAEEIYARRQNLRRTQTRRATVNVSKPKNLKLLKRVVLQIVICILIYFIFYLINTTNYSFSEDTLSKTKEMISYDFDFKGLYNNLMENINTYLYAEDNNGEQNNEEQTNNEEKVEGEVEKNDEESVNQSEVSYTEESETDRIKANYAFINPVSRSSFIRVWDKRSNSKRSNSLS